MSGLLAPTIREIFLGKAEILEVFNISHVGKVAGCRVVEGKVERGAKVRLIRDDVVIHEGTLSTLKRFKDEVREVPAGQECGMAFANYQDIRAGDAHRVLQRRDGDANALSSVFSYPGSAAAPAPSLLRPSCGPTPQRSDNARKKSNHAKPPSQRQLRVGELIRHKLAEMLARGDIHDDVLASHVITVPEVRLSPDLKLATVVRDPARRHRHRGGDRGARRATSATSAREIARAVNLKFAPDIRFRRDETFEEASRIDALLASPKVRQDVDKE